MDINENAEDPRDGNRDSFAAGALLDAAHPHARVDTSARPVFWLVPAGEDGQPMPTRSIPIMEASALNEILAPVMPMYDLQVAAQLLTMKRAGLVQHLARHKELYPSRYRRVPLKHGPAYVRVLTAKEVNEIAQRVIRTKKSRRSSIVRKEQAEQAELAEASAV